MILETELLIVKNGEARHNGERTNRECSKGGIKFFSGKPLPPFEEARATAQTFTADTLRYAGGKDKRVWRSEETIEASSLLFDSGRIQVVGEPQSGKGTILFGLSEIFARSGWGYVFIDGHYQDTPGYQVTEAIVEADNRRYVIIYDAFDHNFAGSKGGIRTISKKVQEERNGLIIPALDAVTIPVIITSHDEVWRIQFEDPSWRERFSSSLVKYPEYKIPLQLSSNASIAQFLYDNNMPVDQITFLLTLEANEEAQKALFSFYGSKQKVSEVIDYYKSFPVLKELVRDRRQEVNYCFSLMNERFMTGVVALAQIICEAEMQRIFSSTLRRQRQKNGSQQANVGYTIYDFVNSELVGFIT
ncbi:hypothetical protein HYS11_00650 [Candidatus Gottesmanbacteria bacterium]|nr:hypothetical protein [Candidatus Gottesmanbacteria bacterium]